MFKKILPALIVALPLSINAQSAKFGHCNSQDIIPSMQEYKDAETKMKSVQEQYATEGKKIEDELTKKGQAFEELSKSATATEAQRKLPGRKSRLSIRNIKTSCKPLSKICKTSKTSKWLLLCRSSTTLSRLLARKTVSLSSMKPLLSSTLALTPRMLLPS